MVAKSASLGTAPLRTIDQHAAARGTAAAVQSGAMVMAGWSQGRTVSADEYDAAIKKFLKTETGKAG